MRAGIVLRLYCAHRFAERHSVSALQSLQLNSGTLTKVSLKMKKLQLLQYDHFHSEMHCIPNAEAAAKLEVGILVVTTHHIT